jgi:hypothetical protein
MRIFDNNVQFQKQIGDVDPIEIIDDANPQRTSTRSPFRVIKTILAWTGATIVAVSAMALIHENREQNGFLGGVKAQSESIIREINPSSPNATAVYAAGVNAAPGAIVCGDYETVILMFRLYTAHWTDGFQDKLTEGQSRLMRGAGAEEPDPSVFGCIVVPPGTMMLQDPGNAVPVVTVQKENGKFFKGVTMAPMVRREAK